MSIRTKSRGEPSRPWPPDVPGLSLKGSLGAAGDRPRIVRGPVVAVQPRAAKRRGGVRGRSSISAQARMSNCRWEERHPGAKGCVASNQTHRKSPLTKSKSVELSFSSPFYKGGLEGDFEGLSRTGESKSPLPPFTKRGEICITFATRPASGCRPSFFDA